MRLAAAAAVATVLGSLPAWSQSVQYSFTGGVGQAGAVTAGHVATWAGNSQIEDGGAAGSGTVTSVGLTAPSWLTVTGSPVTAAGALAIGSAMQPANLFLASPNGSSGVMAPRAITGSDLPPPGVSALGGITSFSGAAHQWLDSISTAGAPHSSQPSCGDLSNAAASCSVDATNAANIASGVLSAARLPTSLSANMTFIGNNIYAGTSTWNGALFVPIRMVTAAGPVSLSPTTDYLIVIDKTTPGPTTVNYTCVPGFTFLVKDGAGNDASNAITLTPSSGTIDGAATFVMTGSTPGTPPYDARAVTCDAAGNSWVN
ncbi:MAG TPA: hypothetical protein VFQ82_08870 [Stellaceae bacterium]|nr:hypothetical protein [Stellaceae bacterium]